MPIMIEIAPSLDYDDVKPWIYSVGQHDFVAAAGNTGLLFSGDVRLELVGRHDLCATVTLEPGQRHCVSMQFLSPAELQEADTELPQRGGHLGTAR